MSVFPWPQGVICLMLLGMLSSVAQVAADTPGPGLAGKAPRLLQVTVMQTNDALEAGRLLAARSEDSVTRPAVRRVHATADSEVDSHPIQLQVLEGETARVELQRFETGAQLLWVEEATDTGEVLPVVGLASNERVEGFQVRALLSGEEVTIYLHAYRQAHPDPGYPGHVQHAIETVMVGRLGEWMDLGGTLQAVDGAADPNRYRVHHAQGSRMRILARVDLVSAEPVHR